MKQLLFITTLLLSTTIYAFEDGDIINRVCNEYGCVDEHGGNVYDAYNSNYTESQIEGQSTLQDGLTIETDVYSDSEGW